MCVMVVLVVLAIIAYKVIALHFMYSDDFQLKISLPLFSMRGPNGRLKNVLNQLLQKYRE